MAGQRITAHERCRNIPCCHHDLNMLSFCNVSFVVGPWLKDEIEECRIRQQMIKTVLRVNKRS